MDANRWLVFVWLAVALALGSIVVFSALFLWRAIFRRRMRGWAQDSVLLGLSGLVLSVCVDRLCHHFQSTSGKGMAEYARLLPARSGSASAGTSLAEHLPALT